MSDSESDMELSLSANALAALAEFRQEQQQHEEKFQEMFNQTDDEFKRRQEGMNLFKEDWQLSQFWYSDDTANLLADALLDGADEDTVIAVVSAPSVYAAILKKDNLPTSQIYLFEFDKRFELMAGKEFFSFYDFKDPLTFESPIRGKVDRLLIDPPFLNETCQGKSSQTAHELLRKDDGSLTKNGVPKHRLISCTGERMHEIIAKVYPKTHITTFLPEHGNGLSNEFRCYADFEWDGWQFQDN